MSSMSAPAGAACEWSPIKGVDSSKKPWEGRCTPRPWDFPLTLAIPVIGFPDLVGQCLACWGLQTVKPYVILVDTGSSAGDLERIRGFQCDWVDVHSLRFNGRLHPSEYPAIAMDLVFSCCQTDILVSTHQDVFPCRRDLLNDMIVSVTENTPVVGYEMSPREGFEWRGMVSHTLTAFHMPSMHRVGAGWSLERLRHRHGHPHYTPTVPQVGWPDTEILINEILRESGISPTLIGQEANYQRFRDLNIDHFRSYVSSGLWCPAYHAIAREWYLDAVRDGVARCKEWAYRGMQERAVLYRRGQGLVSAGVSS